MIWCYDHDFYGYVDDDVHDEDAADDDDDDSKRHAVRALQREATCNIVWVISSGAKYVWIYIFC